eukprot:gnl/TRDRNA2_/TRDRNA2_170761_c0_seq3.p1 gnl/TRDRNA2_/TRDRNA2_170761_c0~~gnl/TRDRNA2_/TRDRNA2_170761_c0_seq3.p1  ORF type:complete len:401 (+),score=53.77 gnl/TRDRNA2_/TRDRNA2_170761_c0_seq3:270-1472(+)
MDAAKELCARGQLGKCCRLLSPSIKMSARAAEFQSLTDEEIEDAWLWAFCAQGERQPRQQVLKLLGAQSLRRYQDNEDSEVSQGLSLDDLLTRLLAMALSPHGDPWDSWMAVDQILLSRHFAADRSLKVKNLEAFAKRGFCQNTLLTDSKRPWPVMMKISSFGSCLAHAINSSSSGRRAAKEYTRDFWMQPFQVDMEFQEWTYRASLLSGLLWGLEHEQALEYLCSTDMRIRDCQQYEWENWLRLQKTASEFLQQKRLKNPPPDVQMSGQALGTAPATTQRPAPAPPTALAAAAAEAAAASRSAPAAAGTPPPRTAVAQPDSIKWLDDNRGASLVGFVKKYVAHRNGEGFQIRVADASGEIDVKFWQTAFERYSGHSDLSGCRCEWRNRCEILADGLRKI